MMEAIAKHRSIRKYMDKPVDESLLNEILSAGTRASTTGNMQVYSIIVTKDKPLREKLWEIHFKQDMVLQAPVHLTFCADFNRFNTWCRMRKAEPGYDNFLSFFTASIDALLASQNVCLEAEEHGLGICYLGTVTYMAGKIIELLELPHGVVPVACVVMGHPDESPGLTGRLPLEAVVHSEKYQEYTAGRIDSIYAERESSEETKELLKINEKETLAQVFTDNRYTRKDNEFFSNQFLDVIRKQGYLGS